MMTSQQELQAISWRNFRGRARPDLDPSPLLSMLTPEFPLALENNSRFTMVKNKPHKGSSVWRARLDLGRGEEELFIKLFDNRVVFRVMAGRILSAKGIRRPHHYPIKTIKVMFESSMARHNFEMAGRCLEAGIPVADHLFYLDKRFGPFWKGLLVTKGIAPRLGNNALHYFKRLHPPNPVEARVSRRQIIEDLGAILRRIRASGIRFRDLKLHNLVLEDPPGGRPRFVVIDLDRAAPDRWDYPEETFIRRFSAFLPGFSTADKIRLARSYLAAGDDPRSWRELCPQGARR